MCLYTHTATLSDIFHPDTYQCCAQCSVWDPVLGRPEELKRETIPAALKAGAVSFDASVPSWHLSGASTGTLQESGIPFLSYMGTFEVEQLR